MWRKFCHRIGFALVAIFACWALSSFASDNKGAEDKCSELLNAKTSFLKNPIQSVSDNLPALISRLKPVYSTDRFDLRVLSRSVSRNSFSPVQLKEKAISELEDLQNRYDNLGFRFNAFLQVLVEAQQGAIGQLRLGPKFEFIWHNSELETAWVGNAREMIGIPNILGMRSLFVGRGDKGGFEELPRFLALTVITPGYHSLQNRFVVSHELAHETENMKSHQDWIWREARADFLAYITTSEAELVFPEGIKLAFVDSDGLIYEETVTKARSLSEPTVAHSLEIMPNLHAHHHNSQIISSALFELSQKLGVQKMIDFVHWMDKQEGIEAIPKLVGRPKNADDFIFSPEIEYVDEENIEAVRTSILKHLMQIGSLFRRWAAQETDEASRTIVEAVLSSRHI